MVPGSAECPCGQRARIAIVAMDNAKKWCDEATAEKGDPAKWGEAITAAGNKWGEAITAAGNAVALLKSEADERLQRDARDLLTDLEKDLKMVERLNKIRLEKIKYQKESARDIAQLDGEYARAFQGYDIDVDRLGPPATAALIRGRPIRIQLAAAWSTGP